MKIASSTPIAYRAEKKEMKPRVAIFDYFSKEGDSPRHGEQVERLIEQTGNLKESEIQNFHNSYERPTSKDDVFEASPEEFRDKLREHTIQSVTGFYGATQKNMETILEDEDNTIRVINQSLSQSPVRVAREFVTEALMDDDFRMKVKDAFDLPKRARKSSVAEAIIKEVNDTFSQSEEIKTARKEFLSTAEEAYEQGIAHVVTAGNLGRYASSYKRIGIQVPDGAYKSIMVSPYSTVIGATASQGTMTTRDDRAASFTSRHAGAEFAMHGVNVDVLDDDPKKHTFSSGTSYAAPQASALIDEIFQENPNLSVREMENILYKSTIPVRGPQDQVGAGQIDPRRARYLAEQSRYVKGQRFEELGDWTKAMVAF